MSAEVQELFGTKVRDAGALVYGWRGENRTSRMAEYTVTVIARAEKPSEPSVYRVTAAWGKIGGSLQRTVKQETTNLTSAMTNASTLVREKKRRQYEEVEEYRSDALDDDWPTSATTADDIELPEPVVIEPPSEDCQCFRAAEEAAQALWADPEDADVTIAPKLMQEGYGLAAFEKVARGARWVVRVDSECSSGYAHVRVFPVDPTHGSAKGGAKGVEDAVLRRLNHRSRREFDFTVVVEEDGNDLWLVDLMRLDGTDFDDIDWLTRQQTLAAQADRIIDRTSPARPGPGPLQIRVPRVVTENLRDTYLGEGDESQFELHELAAPLGAAGWVLPRL